jgi:hypothetical protein
MPPLDAPESAAAPALAEVAEPAAAAFDEPATELLDADIVEGSYEDDLWGAFEPEEAPKTAPVAVSEAQEAEFEAEEFFSFEDESEAIEETGPALEPADVVEEPAVLAADEEMFSFADDLSYSSAADMEPLVLPEYEPLSFQPQAQAVSAREEAVQPVLEPIPVLEPQSAPVVAGIAAAGEQAAAPSLSEAQLVAAISKVSREVIERIVWEVVPDLAEALIKEEIRKLKAGLRD